MRSSLLHLGTRNRRRSRGGRESNQDLEVAFPGAAGSTAPVPEPQRPPPTGNHHSLHVPSVPPPLHLRTLELLAATPLCERARRRAPAPATVQPRERGREGTPTPALGKLTAKLAPSSRRAGGLGSTARVLSAPRSGSLLCREPHRSRTSSWRRRPSSPDASSSGCAPRSQRCVSLRPRPRLPAPALVSP